MKKIVLATFGSLGDLHPYLSLAIELKARGHEVTVATSECYRSIVESDGILFRPVVPDILNDAAGDEAMRRIMDMSGGPEYLFREVMLPVIEQSYTDLLSACEGADAIIGHPLTFAVPLVAAKLTIPWAYVALSPIVFASAYDPPIFSPELSVLRSLHPFIYKCLFTAVRQHMNGWFGVLRDLSKEIGTFPVQRHPVGRDQYSTALNLALYPSILGPPQRDWPKNAVSAGFADYKSATDPIGLSEEFEEFLQSGEPPVVFTLGSAAVNVPGSFYDESMNACHNLGIRAVLLAGRAADSILLEQKNSSIFVAGYAPYSQVFSRSRAVVHQGGIGTTSQCLIAGKPMLIMPFAFDQPDNAARVTRLGVGRSISRRHYTANNIVRELNLLLNERTVARAETIGRIVRMENGRSTACEAIEDKLLKISK